VTWATSVLIFVFLGLSVLDLSPMYATGRRQTSDVHHRLISRYGGTIIRLHGVDYYRAIVVTVFYVFFLISVCIHVFIISCTSCVFNK